MGSFIHRRGSPSAPVWVLIDRPLKDDEKKGFLYSSGYGYVWDKMMMEAGITDYCIQAYRPDISNPNGWQNIEGELNQYRPPIIIPLDAIGQKLIPDMVTTIRGAKYHSDTDSKIEKYAGSILQSPRLTYPHYVIPTFGPEKISKQWKIRDIVISCDLGKAASEVQYWRDHGELQPLPTREAKVDFECFDELLSILDSFMEFPIISNDIETIYPKAPTKTLPSQFYGILPGYPVTVGLANSNSFGISFEFFRDSVVETRELWRRLYRLMKEVPSLGQNFYNFDVNYYEMLGFELPLEKCKDTILLHHQLWPELPHKLDFLSRQYTRDQYWKESGQGWKPGDMRNLKVYNAKDCMITFECYEKMLEELKERGLE